MWGNCSTRPGKNCMNGNGKLIDTNILVHAYVLSDERKHNIAKDIIQKLWEGGAGITTLQNLCEFFFVVTRKVEKPITVSKAKVIVSSFLNTSQWRVIDRDELTVLRAIQLVEEYNIHFWDAIISACMLQHGIVTIVTENINDFSKVKEIHAINPF